MLAAQPGFDPKRELLARSAEARRLTDKIFGIVKPEYLYDRPIPERHRIVFYIGHLEAFDWNLLQTALNRKSPHSELDRLFAFGIDPVDGALPSDSPADWPPLPQVRQYQKSTRQRIDQSLRDLDFSESELEIPGLTPTVMLHVAIEHRLMHAETLAYMFHQFPLDHKIPQSIPTLSSTPYNNEMVTIPAGTASLGKNRDDVEFGWDNEYEELKVPVPAFAIDRFQVTNAEYLEFVNDHGYDCQELWSEEDWLWRVESGISHPVFWQKDNDAWQLRTMFHLVPLPQDWPVYVSHAEASAYARWAGKQLPTEAQWHRAAYGTRDGAENLFPWGRTLPEDMRGNFDFRNWDPVPVNAGQQQPSAFGVVGMIGNGWEWTSSIFEPLPGFQPFSFYPGYSANFFDGKHYVMKGGSPFTAASLLRRSFRNWFQPHYQYVYAGFRCVRNNV